MANTTRESGRLKKKEKGRKRKEGRGGKSEKMEEKK